ncbi:MAG: M20/M25/M40 family metallo-hydrolase [Clostridia bacterium]|nr:M20/M25/M40 family metallo-hydrolase [Clostridia bacterium]
MVNEKRLTNEFIELVKIDSLSRQERKVADVLKAKLSALGLEVVEDEAGSKTGGTAGNIIGRLPGKAEGPAIMFSAHMDTVEPGIGIQPVLKDGVFYSAGDTILGSDNKAGICSILEALRVIAEEGLPHPEIEVVFTIIEEQGLLGAKNLDYGMLKAAHGYVLDSHGSAGTIIVRGPAQQKVEVHIRGRAAHAGLCPEEGISAIQVAALAINRMKLGRIDEETTANIGVITGGKAINIVPDMVHLKGEARSLQPGKMREQTEHMKRVLEEAAREFEAMVSVEIEDLYPEIDLGEDQAVVAAAVRAARNLGLEPKLEATGGGSDANIFNGQGIPVANLGIGMNKVHTTEENIAVADLVLNVRYVVEIIKESVKMLRVIPSST